jgi:hypothetical protein
MRHRCKGKVRGKFTVTLLKHSICNKNLLFRVFPLSIFEVDSTVAVPRDKTELQELLRTNKAIPFHKRVCASCHGVPKSKEWMAANETDGKALLIYLLKLVLTTFLRNCRPWCVLHWKANGIFCPLGAHLHWNSCRSALRRAIELGGKV